MQNAGNFFQLRPYYVFSAALKVAFELLRIIAFFFNAQYVAAGHRIFQYEGCVSFEYVVKIYFGCGYVCAYVERQNGRRRRGKFLLADLET